MRPDEGPVGQAEDEQEISPLPVGQGFLSQCCNGRWFVGFLWLAPA